TWTYAIPAGLQNALVSGNTYRIISRATDNAGNAEFPLLNGGVPGNVGVTVLYDTATINTVISFPVNNQAYVAVSSFSGTADDTATGSGVNGVDIALIDKINRGWNGSDWTSINCAGACNPWQAATFVGTTSGTWTYATLSGAFSSNATYRLYVRGR